MLEHRREPVVAGALRGHGLDESAAWSATERVRVLLDVARPTNVGGRSTADRARRLATAWLDTPSTRAFLRVNRWEGEEWFDRDAWRELADWTMLLDVLDGRDPRRLVTLAGAVAGAAEAAGYNVERLRTAPGGRPTRRSAAGGRTRSTSRRPTRPRAGA